MSEVLVALTLSFSAAVLVRAWRTILGLRARVKRAEDTAQEWRTSYLEWRATSEDVEAKYRALIQAIAMSGKGLTSTGCVVVEMGEETGQDG